jgi:cystathionine beta-lyase
VDEIALGALRLQVEHRVAQGPTVRVLEGSHERVRFDCFEEGAHLHLDPAGEDRVEPMPVRDDPVDWTLAQLRGDLAGWLARSGAEETGPLDAALLASALDRAERAMRHPPLDLDDVSAEALRSRCGEKWHVYPDDVLPVWVADMDYPVAEPIRRRLRRAVLDSDLGYPLHPRPSGLPELLADRMLRLHAWKIDPRRVEVLSDVVQGIYVALLTYAEPGQGVVVQTPIYPPFLGSLRQTGRALVENPLSYGSQGYALDLDGLRAALSDTTRILLLCNPHNPTGRCFSRPELEALAEIALERDLVIVSDEIHADLVFAGHRHLPIASLAPEVEARTLTLTAASKAFNVAGLRCAFAIFGSPELRKRFLELPRHLRGGINSLGIEATRSAWQHGAPWLERVREHLSGNRDFVARFVEDHLPGIVHHPPEATYLAWLDCRSLQLEPSPYDFFLERARLALSDGRNFGEPGEGFVRLNFATARPILVDALTRMQAALEGTSPTPARSCAGTRPGP